MLFWSEIRFLTLGRVLVKYASAWVPPSALDTLGGMWVCGRTCAFKHTGWFAYTARVENQWTTWSVRFTPSPLKVLSITECTTIKCLVVDFKSLAFICWAKPYGLSSCSGHQHVFLSGRAGAMCVYSTGQRVRSVLTILYTFSLWLFNRLCGFLQAEYHIVS